MPTVVSVFGVEPNRIGGTETFARELSLQLAERGWKSVLCFDTQPPDDVADFLQSRNVTLEVFSAPTTFNWAAINRLVEIVRRHRPTILHLHYVGFISIYPWLAKMFGVQRIFFTDHSSRPTDYQAQRAPFWKRQITRLINAPISKVICVSNFGCRSMLALDLLPSDRFRLIYNAVDISRVSPNPSRGLELRRHYGIPDERKVVIQISWIIPEKGIADLLEVAKLVIQQHRNVHFVIVGEGPFRQEFTTRAEVMGLNQNVTWTGLVKDPFGVGIFDAADVVCQLSRWQELFGWMIAEAMAFGKPVVATRVGGISELVEEDQTGFLVPMGDFRAAAERVQMLIENPELRQSLGNVAREKVRTKFNLKKNVEELIRLYLA